MKHLIKESIIGGLYLFGISMLGAIVVIALYNI